MDIHTLPNGLAVVAENIPHLQSVAYALWIPAGTLLDREKHVGTSLVLSELTSRGAAGFSSRELSDQFDMHGIRHSEGAELESAFYRGQLLSEHLPKALELVAMMVQQPALPEEEIPAIQRLLMQELSALNDNPARRVMVELGNRYFPAPYNRGTLGTEEGLSACNAALLREEWQRLYKPEGSVLSVAGSVDPSEVYQLAERVFGNWQGQTTDKPAFDALPARGMHHVADESAQLQIALSYPAPAFDHEHYYTAKVISQLLSGGMFGRLFIEVREKRGLCYSVYAYHSATINWGITTAYAGTTPERAQETLDVTLAELRKLAPANIEADELQRAKANLKASLVMAQESAGSRATSNAGDWWLTRRVRSLDEVSAAVDRVGLDDIDACMAEFPVVDPLVVTLGPRELELGA